MKPFLLGILFTATTVLLLIIFWIGLTVLTVGPGQTVQAGVFEASRPIMLDTQTGKVAPAGIVTSTGTVTYTFVVRED